MEAISHAGAAVGILTNSGVVLAAEKKILSKVRLFIFYIHISCSRLMMIYNVSQLLEMSETSEKMHKLDHHVAVAVAGLNSDANTLINSSRLFAQRYAMSYSEPVPIEQLVHNLCDQKQGYTQFGGLRPFGVSFLFAGWDKYSGFQLYQSDPSGNYAGWTATAIGANSQAARSFLKSEYVENMNVLDAKKLAVKVLKQTMDSTTLLPEKFEMCEIVSSPTQESPVHFQMVPLCELVNLCNETS
tara:strand:- start:72 stop:800 length:729 start_codon:yes stop_codon:yes gene_type:complete